MSTKKTDPGDSEVAIEEQQKPVLRRSSRTTRGPIKPIVDLAKDVEEDQERNKDDAEYKGKPKRTARKSVAKPVSTTTKTPAKRGTGKKVVAKGKSDDKIDDKGEDEMNLKEASVKLGKSSRVDDVKADDDNYEDDDDELFYNLNEREMKEINNAFDVNKLRIDDELLDADGLRTAMRSLGFEPRGDEIKKLVKKFASSKSGKITRDGFHKIMAFKYSTTPTMGNDRSNDEISRVFNLLDLDKTGLITLENLKSISKELDEELTENDLREMIEEADLDGDFMINKDEFHNIMKKTSLY